MEFDIFGRKRRKREEEGRRRQEEQWEAERKKKEEERDRRWGELEQKYGVDREELDYQFHGIPTYWRQSDGKQQRLTPRHIGLVRIIRKNQGSDASTRPYDDDEFRFLWIDVEKRLSARPNRNVFISGASGEGKTTLGNLLLSVTEGVKIVFSFKVDDEYLRIGYPIADMSRLVPNPFQDVDAFVSAFAIAFPITTIGITASQIPSMVRELAYGCASWREFNRRLERRVRETKDRVQLSALYFIQQQVKSLRQETTRDASAVRQLIGSGTSLVLDFSRLSDSAKVFFAELTLRQMWNNMPDNRPIICVDEAHRLTRGTFEKYHSILYEMAKEIRARGSLWTSTQNYTDIEDDVRNQFAAQFVFATSSKADLEALRAIDPMLAWSVTVLRPHQFLDAKSGRVHDSVWVYTFSPEGIAKETPPVSVEEYLSSAPGVARTTTTFDYEAAIGEKLKEEAVWVSGLAGYFSEKYGVSKDEAKLRVRDVLEKLVNADEVQRMKCEAVSGETVVLYFRKCEDENESLLHRSMVRRAVEACGGEDVIHVASSGEALPDIELRDWFVECETGLKKKTGDLEERIGRFCPSKPFVIVVPNSDVGERYGRWFASDRVSVTTLKHLLESINEGDDPGPARPPPNQGDGRDE